MVSHPTAAFNPATSSLLSPHRAPPLPRLYLRSSSRQLFTSVAAAAAAALPNHKKTSFRMTMSNPYLNSDDNNDCVWNSLANQNDNTNTNNKNSARSFSTTSKTSSTSASSSLSSSNNNSATTTKATISTRGASAVGLLPTYLSDARSVERYDPVTAPHGALQLGVAESQLLEDLLLPQINQITQTVAPFTSDCIYYQPTAGRASLRSAVAEYMQELLSLTNNQQQHCLDQEGIIVGAGCNAVLENLCFCLADPGDVVLIPTPYYAAFEFDLVARAALQIVPVYTMSFFHDNGGSGSGGNNVNNDLKSVPKEAYYPTRASLDAAVQRAGKKPRILLLSHPQNPLGICYPPEVLQECIDWCREHEIHLISDEIYAGSVYRTNDDDEEEITPFKSALELAATTTSGSSSNHNLGLGPYIHWVYAMSKDFALSGLRVGVAYSENEDIRMPLQKLNDMCQISSQTQVLVEHMMTTTSTSTTTTTKDGSSCPKKWTQTFREENHKRLRARGDALHALLDRLNVPYIPATAGLFCWLDLSQFLPPPPADGNGTGTDEERERALYLDLVQEFGLLLTPGLSMRNERPGFFRCVFTAAKEEEFELALQRLETFVTAKRGSSSY